MQDLSGPLITKVPGEPPRVGNSRPSRWFTDVQAHCPFGGNISQDSCSLKCVLGSIPLINESVSFHQIHLSGGKRKREPSQAGPSYLDHSHGSAISSWYIAKTSRGIPSLQGITPRMCLPREGRGHEGHQLGDKESNHEDSSHPKANALKWWFRIFQSGHFSPSVFIFFVWLSSPKFLL